MESWKEELYHYGIKGMKWGKRKNKEAEQIGREFETNARRYMDNPLSKYDERDVQAYFRSKHKVEKHHKDVYDRYKKQGIKKHYTKGLKSNRLGEIVSSTKPKNGSSNRQWSLTGNAADNANKEVRRRVKRADTKYKVKAFTRKIFKKR